MSDSILSREVSLVLTVATVLAVALFIWAVFVRKRRHPDPHVRVLQPGSSDGTADGSSSKRNRHRRHHRSHESRRNPTLQETGGLPPLRPENEPPKF